MLVPRWVCRAMIVLGAVGLLEAATAMLLEDPLRWRSLAWLVTFAGPMYSVGVLAYARRPDLPIARILLLAGGLWAAPGPSVAFLVAGADERLWLLYLLTGVPGLAALAATAMLVALYPDGRYQRGYERLFVQIGWVLVAFGAALSTVAAPTVRVDLEHVDASVANPLRLAVLAGAEPVAGALMAGVMGLPVVAVVLLAIRYRRCEAQARRQIRWLLLVPIAVVAVAAVAGIIEIVGIDQPWFRAAGAVTEYAVLALVPLALGLSILRHQLLNVDVVIRKSVVYAALWTVIAAAYVAVAAGVGIASSQLLPVTMVVLLTIVATLAFQPARRGLERLTDRWVFGRRLDGYALLGQLGSQLETTIDPSEVLAGIAETVLTGLRLEWARVAVYLRADEPDREMSARAGSGGSKPVESVPLSFAGEPLGVIECGPKLDGGFTAEDRQVLATLARQAALAVNNARLTAELEARLADIRAQTAEIAASRARLVQAADAERRRIERDLHDGAQQQLVALIAGLQLARNQLARGPERVDATLAGLQAEATALHSDILELTRGIHPPVLTDRGLVEALQSRAERLPLDVTVEVAPELRDVRFADEIEGAAYFVAAEALTNVLKHSGAGRVTIRLHCVDGQLRIRVRDDGAGHNGALPGRGLTNMADRLEALGGRLVMSDGDGGGCQIDAYLPARVRDGI